MLEPGFDLAGDRTGAVDGALQLGGFEAECLHGVTVGSREGGEIEGLDLKAHRSGEVRLVPSTSDARVTVKVPGMAIGPRGGGPQGDGGGGSRSTGVVEGRRRSQETRCRPFSRGPSTRRTTVPLASRTVRMTFGSSSSSSARRVSRSG